MDAALKGKWTAALRGGEFEQAIEFMKKDDRYCCLGVLCVVSGASCYTKNGTANYAHVERLIGREDISRELIEMNDHGKSFTEIADYIDGHL